MKKIYAPARVEEAVEASPHREMLRSIPAAPFLIQYEPGEFVSMHQNPSELFQVVASGEVSIYFIRDDGSRFSLARSGRGTLIGETDVLGIYNQGVFAEATKPLTCIAFSLAGVREALLDNRLFLRTMVYSLTEKMNAMMGQDAAPIGLSERVLYYIREKCPDAQLKGVEQAAFHLHCSPRQLQRVLNRHVEEGALIKTGKGRYRLPDGKSP